MPETVRLRALIGEYDRLRHLDGGAMTTQRRGSLFNTLIADILNTWGIPARSSTITSAGEIDVSFKMGAQRFIAEAKWESSKTNEEQLSKLRLRLDQRMRGTIGVFISMAGYSRPAVAALPVAGDRSIILFDKTHVDAMVSGLVPPDELLDLALEHAAYTGQAYATLLELLAPETSKPQVSLEVPPAVDEMPLAPGMSAQVICVVPGTGPVGLERTGEDTLLVCDANGVSEVNLARGTTTWKAPVRGCRGNPLLLRDGAVLIARGHAIGAISKRGFAAIAGGFSGRSTLLADTEGGVWVIDPVDDGPHQGAASLVRLGSRLGEEHRLTINPPTPWAVGAVWMDDKRLALCHQNSVSLIDPDIGVTEQIYVSTSPCAGLVRWDQEVLVTISGYGDMGVVDLVTGRTATLGQLPQRTPVRGSARAGATAFYVAAGARDDTTSVIRVDMGKAAGALVSHAFATADSGDLAGYRAQVLSLNPRLREPPERSEAELWHVFNEMSQVVSDHLSLPLSAKVEELGLEPLQDHSGPSLDGAWPPGYGGHTLYGRWRYPDHPEAWLEVAVGRGHRSWPAERLDDLLLTLVLAVMTDGRQHTVLSRLVQVAPEDPDLVTKLETLVADADRVLEAAAVQLKDSFVATRGRPSKREPEHPLTAG